MPRKPSRRLHERLDDLFAGLPAPEPDEAVASAPPRPSISVPGGWLWESDREGRYTWCSPELSTFLGVSTSDILARDVAEIGLDEASAAELRTLLASPAAIENIRLTYRASDGSRVHALLSADIRPGPDGRPAGLRGAVQVLEIAPRTDGNGTGASTAPVPSTSAALSAGFAEGANAVASTPAPPRTELPPSLAAAPAEAKAPAVEEAGAPLDDEALPEEDVVTPWEAHTIPLAPAKPAPVEKPPAPPTPSPSPTGSLDRPSRPIRRRQTGRLTRPETGEPAQTAPARPGTGELTLDHPSRPVRKRQTGRLSPETADAPRLAVPAPQAAEEVSPFEPAPRIATWGPSAAYVDSEEAIQPLTLDSAEAVQEPRIDGNRLLVPIRVQDEVLGVLAFEGPGEGKPWAERDIEMATAISQQLAVTLQDARTAQLTQQALEEMREADRLKTQFLANMSHELRTPLNSIIGFSRVILKGIDGPVNETQETDLKAIHSAGLHLLGLINDILDVSKIEAGKMELTFGEVDLAEVVHGVMSTAGALVKEKPIELRTDIQEDLPPIQADSIRVRQVLLNLVSNSAKFTDEGYVEVSAHLIEEGEQPEVLVAVADTGSGISLIDQAKLFEPFSQVDASPTRKTGGTGLGLSICRHLVELHGGTIWVESTPGEGSVFYFTLPVQQLLGEPEAGEAPLVLAVDDHPSVLARYRATFESLGYRFQALPQADGAFELATQLQPGLIVVDPHLPSQAAWGFLQRLRQAPGTRSIPLVLGSFHPDSGRAYQLHADDVMPWPVRSEDLAETLKGWSPEGKASPSVLVVADSSAELEELRGDLAEGGAFTVRTAATGAEFYDLARRERPDVIALQAFMAKAEGFRVLEVVRKDQVLGAVPLVLLLNSQPHPEERRQLALYVEYLQRQGTASEADYLAEMKRVVEACAPLL